MKKSLDFYVKRPQKKSVITLIISFVLLAAVWLLFYFFFSPSPQTIPEKIFQAFLFLVAVLGTFFLGAFLINSIICLLAAPSIKIRENTLSVIGNYDMKMEDIDDIEEVKDKKGKTKKLVVRSNKTENVITIKSHISDIPLEEVKEKIESFIGPEN